MSTAPVTAVFITLGNNADLGIDHKGDLIVRTTYNHGPKPDQQLNLGRATRKRISDIQDYLERLKSFAIEEGNNS